MKARIVVLFSAVMFMFSVQAETFMRYRLSAMGGTLMKGSIIDKFNTGMPLGFDMGFEFQPTGKWQSLQQWNNASVGVGMTYLNMGNNEYLGNAVAPYAYLNIPFVRLRHFVFGIRPGFGVAFVDKTYYNTINDVSYLYNPLQAPNRIANEAIGSHTNAYFAEALYMEIPIKKGWSIVASYGWYHISNGSIRQPNSGYNMFNGQLGLSYMPYADKYNAPAPERNRGLYGTEHFTDNNPNMRPWCFSLAATGGIRQAYYADNRDGERFFGVGTLSLAFHYRFVDIFQLGIGVDGFYDAYYSKKLTAPYDKYGAQFRKTYIDHLDLHNSFRVGLSLQPEFVIGNFSAVFHFGIYLFDPVKNLEPYNDIRNRDGKPLNRGIIYPYDIANAGVKQDGWLYTRIVTRYMVTKHLFVQLDMKSHLMKAEFISAGLGLKL